MNKYFEEIGEKYRDQVERMSEFVKERDEYAESHTLEELEAWHDENAPKALVTAAEITAYGIYEESIAAGNKEITITKALHSGEIPRLMDVFRRAGVKAFVFAKADLNAFDILEDICVEGYRLDRIVQVNCVRFNCKVETSGVRIVLSE